MLSIPNTLIEATYFEKRSEKLTAYLFIHLEKETLKHLNFKLKEENGKLHCSPDDGRGWSTVNDYPLIKTLLDNKFEV